MTIAGSLIYGNYFYMVGSGPYQVELRIHAPRPEQAAQHAVRVGTFMSMRCSLSQPGTMARVGHFSTENGVSHFDG